MTKPNIELNKLYNYFDDGKIRLSRLLKVLITDIIPFNEIDADTLELWKKEVENYDWLYSENIVHAYEKRLPVEEDVFSDFYLPQGKVYVEFWGIENDQNIIFVKKGKKKSQIYIL